VAGIFVLEIAFEIFRCYFHFDFFRLEQKSFQYWLRIIDIQRNYRIGHFAINPETIVWTCLHLKFHYWWYWISIKRKKQEIYIVLHNVLEKKRNGRLFVCSSSRYKSKISNCANIRCPFINFLHSICLFITF
jgi:hypothetical protein